MGGANVSARSYDAVASTETNVDQSQPNRSYQPPIWLQDYKTSFACIIDKGSRIHIEKPINPRMQY